MAHVPLDQLLYDEMRRLHNTETERMYKEVSPEATREYLRMKALSKYFAYKRRQKPNWKKK